MKYITLIHILNMKEETYILLDHPSLLDNTSFIILDVVLNSRCSLPNLCLRKLGEMESTFVLLTADLTNSICQCFMNSSTKVPNHLSCQLLYCS